MINSKFRGVFSVMGSFVLFLCAAFLLNAPMARAGDAAALLKEFNKEIRNAQRDMFSGKNEKAIASLESLRGLIAGIEEADPDSPQVKTAKSKYTKLVKDLERKTGQNLGGGTLTVKASTKAKLPPKPESKPMPDKESAPAVASAEGDAETKIKDAKDLIRQAEKNAFAGKNEEASQQLSQAKSLMDQIKASDPTNSQLKLLESKYARIEKNIARKTRTVAEKTGSVTEKKEAASRSGQDKLPHKARRPFQQAKNSLASIDRYLARLADPDYSGDKGQLVDNAGKALDQAKAYAEEAGQAAAEKGTGSHPVLDQMQTDIASAEKRIQEAKSEYDKEKTAAAASSEEVNSDVMVLRKAYGEYRPIFDKATGVAPYFNDLKPLKSLIAEIEDFETNHRAQLEEKLKNFAGKYGITREEIDAKADSMGYSGEGRASFPYAEMTAGIENIKKTRAAAAGEIIERAVTMQSNASAGLHDFSRVETYDRIKEWGEMALRFDPENQKANDFMGGLDEWIQTDTKALNAKIDSATWPEQAAEAPADAVQLCAASKEFLQNQADQGAAQGRQQPRKILQVVITGPWRIFKRNILEEPVQYCLPMAVAEQWDIEKDMNLARVYHISLLTEEFKGVKKAPPFIGATVGDSYYIRPANVK